MPGIVIGKWISTVNSVRLECEFPAGLEDAEAKACPLVYLGQRNQSMAKPDAIHR